MPQDYQRQLVMGVDLGGTKTAAALATAEGEILSRGYCPTLGEAGSQDIIGSILETMEEAMSRGKIRLSQLLGIGLAAAGVVDSDRGMVISSPHIPGLREAPLKQAVEQRFGVPAYMGNDATLAALGEWHFGLKRSVANLVYVTISTGIGGGIIANGKLYAGAGGTAGEIGHMTIDVNGPHCNCGNTGCWETLASGTALAREAVREIREGANTSIAGLVGGDLSRIDARVVFQAAKGRDELANKLISRLAYYFGVGLANLVNIFAPELILIGGGLAKMGDLLLQPAISLAKERAYVTLAYDVEIRPALLGDDSGVLGAVAFVLDRSGQLQ